MINSVKQVKNFADVKFVVTDGSLTIAPKSINPEDEKTGIKVTNPADSKYDGEEHKNKQPLQILRQALH